MTAWSNLVSSTSSMDDRRYELITLAAARCFFSKLLDALGAEPDAAYRQLEEDLRRRLESFAKRFNLFAKLSAFSGQLSAREKLKAESGGRQAGAP